MPVDSEKTSALRTKAEASQSSRSAEEMQHIPAEIINEIFKNLILDILLVHNPKIFPWYLGQICASWRAEFMSTSWIWRKFIIDVTQIRKFENAACLVKLCIQRSKNQPLSFSFIYTDSTNSLYSLLKGRRRQYINQMLSDLIVVSQRWEVADLGIDLLSFKAFRPPNLSSHFPEFPLLHSMALRSRSVLGDKPKCQELFLRAPRLTRVKIDCFPAFDLDWSRLTVLTLHYASNVADVLSVMRRLLCIEKFRINFFVAFSKDDEEQDAMIALPALKVLSCPGDVLRHLRAPALEELRMDIRPEALEYRPLPDGAISSLRTSSSSITRLILGNLWCIKSDAKRILQELPNVTKLYLSSGLCNNLSDVLPYNLQKGIQILPKLELLLVDNYDDWWGYQDTIETLCATVASRTSKPSLFEWPYRAGKLKELRIINYEYQDISHLKSLCKEREVKCLAFESFQKAGHMWCSEGESCAFDLCNVNSVFCLDTESLKSR